ncbi:MAG: hypothetical protein HDQ98_17625 [Lachnospiraceae bacterium]|nr:hypothetical protein [Lachnospiraceae bacterium]
MHMGLMLAAETPSAGADMSVVVNAIETVVQVVGKVWDVVVGNPFLLFALGAAALTIGAGVFTTIRHSAG